MTSKIQTNLRIEPALREQLQKAADAAGVSVTKEITDRLERSFSEKRHWEALDNPVANGIAAVLAQVMYAAGHNAGGLSTASAEGSKNWHENPYAYDQVCRAVAVVMENLRPPGSVDLPGLASNLPANKQHVAKSMVENSELFQRIGTIVAEGLLSEIATVDNGASTKMPVERAERAHRLHQALGPVAERLRNNLDVER